MHRSPCDRRKTRSANVRGLIRNNMKNIFVISTLLVSQTLFAQVSETGKGSAETVIQKDYSYLRVDGAAAKALYVSMTDVEAKNNQGEAGEGIYFKDGESFTCYHDLETPAEDPGAYACTLSISNPAKGTVQSK